MLGGQIGQPMIMKHKVRSTAHRTTISVPADSNPVARTAVSLEYASLRHKAHCPLGMYIIPATGNLLIWDAVFFVHQGYYADAILKFRLSFPENYPEKPPVVQFVTDVFHPLIAPDGIFNLAPRFRPWRPKEHHVFDILHWLKAAFKKHALDEIKETDCLNKEAFRLYAAMLPPDTIILISSTHRYHNTTASFAALASQSSMLSRSSSALFESDSLLSGRLADNGIVFQELEPEQLQGSRLNLGLQNWDEEV